MSAWREVVRYSVIDLTQAENAGFLSPGFYWFIPLDGEQAQPGLEPDQGVTLTGPFPTKDAARDDALRWIHGALQASDDTPELRRAA